MISILGPESDGKKSSQKSQVGTAASFLEVQLVVPGKRWFLSKVPCPKP